MRNAQDAREAVRRLKRDGADFVKVYSNLSREAYFAVADESKVLSIPFAGHVPESVTPAEASDAGQVSIEHIYRFLETSFPESSKYDKLYVELESDLHISAAEKQRRRDALNREYIAKVNPYCCVSVFRRLIQNHTWVVPTVVDTRANHHIGDDEFTHDPRLAYVRPEQRFWDAQHFPFFNGYLAMPRAYRLRQYDLELATVRASPRWSQHAGRN